MEAMSQLSRLADNHSQIFVVSLAPIGILTRRFLNQSVLRKYSTGISDEPHMR